MARTTKPFVVLDWDGTLAVAQSISPINGQQPGQSEHHLHYDAQISMDQNGVKGPTALFLRPGWKDFLARLSKAYEIGLWTFGVEAYVAECFEKARLADFFRGRVIVREKMLGAGVQLKDLWLLKIPLNQIVIVDDSNHVFGLLNPYNCIDIPSWKPEASNDRVLRVMPYIIEHHFRHVLAEKTQEELETLRSTIIARAEPPPSHRPREYV